MSGLRGEEEAPSAACDDVADFFEEHDGAVALHGEDGFARGLAACFAGPLTSRCVSPQA